MSRVPQPTALRGSLAALVFSVALLAAASPALAISKRTLIAPTGAASTDNFGVSAAGIGDFNGDGFDDVLAGAWQNDAGGPNAGRVYVYYGGPAADRVADLTLTGAAANDQFGYSAAGAGDVNGDGFADVIVGAWGNDAAGGNAGRAYVYYGGFAPDAIADLTLTGEAAGDEFGYSVAGAGDVNHDGYADVIVGAHGNDAAGNSAGRAYVYIGGIGPDPFLSMTLTGAAASDQFGISVAGAGDLNGDGFDDLIVGAIGHDAPAVNSGRAYVFYGVPGFFGDAIADNTLVPFSPVFQAFGRSVAGVGDVNGDGFADVAVGALDPSAGDGIVFFYYGSPHGAIFGQSLATGINGDQFGTSVAGVGDVNRDGFTDLMVGAWNGSRAYLYHGGVSLDGASDMTFEGNHSGDGFGFPVSGAGDVNGDGFVDLVVGAFLDDGAGPEAGRAHVISIYPYNVVSPNGGEQWVAGRPATIRWRGRDLADVAISMDGGLNWSMLAPQAGGQDENQTTILVPAIVTSFARVRLSYTGQLANHANSDLSDGVFQIVLPTTPPAVAHRLQRTFTGAAPGDFFGAAGVAGAGDVNGDGYPDLIVGAGANDAGGLNAGRAYLYHGGPAGDAVADLTLTGAAAGDQFGIPVAGAGDVNGDGFADLIVGASGNDAGGADAGRAYVYHGGPAADAVADLVLTGATAGDQFGYPAAGAGDMNGDGYDDVIVGTERNDAGGNDAGRAYVFFGGPGADATADLVLTGANAFDAFGVSVAGAGDVNGDGFADAIVGAHGSNFGGPLSGAAFVYYGAITPDATPDLVLTPPGPYEGFGGSVAGVGDVNGDGFDDMLVGAVVASVDGVESGKAYLFYGGPTADGIHDLAFSGVGLIDNFGLRTGAGDLNGDGFADLLISADENDDGGDSAGRAYIYFGGPGADAIADITITGIPGDDLSEGLAGAGDVNGDGFDDVIVAATGNDAGGVDAGRVYLFDCKRYFVLGPNDDEVWNVGATATVSWLGAEPADLWLSVDAGATWQLLHGDVGGAESNVAQVQVPHLPTKFARLKVAPVDAAVIGDDRSDSTFTIQSSVALLNFVATLDDGGATLSWSTEPSVGPGGLAGYRLYRLSARSSDGGMRLGPELIAESRYTDGGGAPGASYRLTAVNGLGVELEVGRISLAPARALAAWPLPYRGGQLEVGFATAGGLGGGSAEATLEVYDLSGRRLRTLARGVFEAGHHSARWNGLDEGGRAVPNGLYFLRARGAGHDQRLKIVVAR